MIISIFLDDNDNIYRHTNVISHYPYTDHYCNWNIPTNCERCCSISISCCSISINHQQTPTNSTEHGVSCWERWGNTLRYMGSAEHSWEWIFENIWSRCGDKRKLKRTAATWLLKPRLNAISTYRVRIYTYGLVRIPMMYPIRPFPVFHHIYFQQRVSISLFKHLIYQ